MDLLRSGSKYTFFSTQVVRLWDRLPRGAVDVSFLGVVKARFDEALSN